MSIKKAQKIVYELDEELGIFLTQYQRSELEYLKSKLEEFLDLEIDMDDLQDADDYEPEDEDDEESE